HVGHCYTTLVADVAARFQRFAGRDVFFLTGTDEHAEKVVESAERHGMTPLEWADRNAAEFQAAFAALNFSNDDFIRTTEKRHTEKVVEFIRRLKESGDIELGDYEGWWDVSQEEYVTETTAREHEYKSPVTGRALERRKQRNYFFKLSKYQERLAAHIEAHPDSIRPESRRNEVLGRIRAGLQDVPVSRAVDASDTRSQWGILMPDDPEHRVYVWIDALFNYMTAVETDARRKYWPAAVHVMAKDILWFHAVIWPCMLMALGEKLPGCVYAHSYWIREGRKMSKSLGNFLDLPTIEAYCARYGRDAFRWFLATQGPMGATDADFAHAKFVEVYNADLANGIGNAASRVANMIAKYFDGKCPDAKGVTAHADHDWPAIAGAAVESAMKKVEAMDLPGALQDAVRLAARVDGYIHATEPFKLAKDPAKMDEVGVILYHSAEALRIASCLMWPAMPEQMEELWRRFSCEMRPGEDALAEVCRWGGLKAGDSIVKGDALFMRADPKEAAPAPAGAEA
ncbi:MAG: methionine--tRNA ligase, partial [Planctomycetota bacterium]|nr:methionine--tRNA ligase [Planctomycetota bacterium]